MKLMNRKTLDRVRNVNTLKRAAAEARRSQLAGGIADGIALQEQYRDKDCGLGLHAELAMSHVARTMVTIERGLSALRERESAANDEIARLGYMMRRIQDAIADAIATEQRQLIEIELRDQVERALGALKSDASESPDKSSNSTVEQ